MIRYILYYGRSWNHNLYPDRFIQEVHNSYEDVCRSLSNHILETNHDNWISMTHSEMTYMIARFEGRLPMRLILYGKAKEKRKLILNKMSRR